MIKSIIRFFINQIFRTRQYQNRIIKKIAKKTKNKLILEIGSGKKVKGDYPYSCERFFIKNNKFIKSDVNPDFGHSVIDITKFKEKNRYDGILCLNVLEHIFDYENAVLNMYKALKNDGQLILSIPFIYPLHDQPNDFWRFSIHSLRKLLKKHNFRIIKEYTMGIKEFPIMYILILKKS